MDHIAVFAGLGSDLLFSNKLLSQARRDAGSAIGKYLLQQSHRIFQETVFAAGDSSDTKLMSASYNEPSSLLSISPTDVSNSILQHSTICLAQLLRYLQVKYIDADTAPACNYATGLCAGIIPAVAVAASSDIVTFLTQAGHAYRLALHVGIAVENFSAAQDHSTSAIFIDGILAPELNALIACQRKVNESPLYISSKLNRTSFIVTGAVSQIEALCKKRLVSRKVKSVSISRYYHNSTLLSTIAKSIAEDYAAGGLQYPSCSQLINPIISPANGEAVDSSFGQTLLELVLSWIFLVPVNWAAVDEHLLNLHRAHGKSLHVENFGPGYGAMRAHRSIPGIQVHDMTFTADRSAQSSSCIQDVAIVGMAAHLPDADDIDEFWSNLTAGHNSCREIPESRFDYSEYYVDADEAKKGRSLTTKWGNFVRNPYAFDAKFFGVSPREALSIDPQQRLMLKTAHRALEDAGYSPDTTPSFARETFACYVGEATNDYVENLRHDIDVYYTPGTHPAFLSGRVSYYYGWSGPSVTVNTVCSSSMTAINAAVRALQAGDCRSALVGGVNVITSPDMFLGLDRAHFLSPSGQCKTFDSDADGYCRAEGCGAVVLKSLKDALAEGDKIHGVIRASELNQSGSSTSITHPHPPTQQKLLERLLTKSGVVADDVTVVEAHGTGTQAGDPSEMSSIVGALCVARPPNRPLHVVSHKANMGHSEAASGLIATIKMCLMFQKSVIPPQILLNKLNPRIKDLDKNNVIIPLNAVSWNASNERKRVGIVNNFGAAGSNGALLLEAPSNLFDHPTHPGANFKVGPYLLRLTAKSEAHLEQLRNEVLKELDTIEDGPELQNLCYTLSARRISYDRQVIVSGSTRGEIRQKLRAASIGTVIAKGSSKTVFIFSGQGAQYMGMGRELYERFPAFRTHVEHCESLLRAWGRPSCLSVLLAEKGAEASASDHEQVQAFQVAVFALEVGLARLLMSWELKPTALVGHSLGEYAALVIGGALSLNDALRLVSDRAALLVTLCKPGQTGMLAMNTRLVEVQKILEARPELSDVEIACDNGPENCVVGGKAGSLTKLQMILKEIDIKCSMLPIPFAFHTKHVDAISASLDDAASGIELRPLQIPTLLGAKGKILPCGEVVSSHKYFSEHCRNRVKFTQGLEELHQEYLTDDSALWIEVGPHGSTLPMIRSQTSTTAGFYAALDKRCDAGVSIVNLFGALAGAGQHLAWRRFFEDTTTSARLVNAPGMSFLEADYVVPFKETLQVTEVPTSTVDGTKLPALPYTFLSHVISSRSDEVEYETDVAVLKPYIDGHAVCGIPLCPASVFHELAISATANHLDEQGLLFSVCKVSYLKPLVLSKDDQSVVRTVIKTHHGATKRFNFEIYSGHPSTSSFSGTLHCSGLVQVEANTLDRYERLFAESDKSYSRLSKTSAQILNRQTIYDRIFSRVVEYSTLYQSINTMKINEDIDETIALCTLPDNKLDKKFTADPVIMDTILHITGFICNLAADDNHVYIGHSMEEARLLRPDFEANFSVRSTITSLHNGTMAIGDAVAMDSAGVIAVITGVKFQRLSVSRLRSALSLASDSFTGQVSKAAPVPVLSGAARLSPSIMSKPETASKIPAAVDKVIDTRSAVLDIVAASCSVPKANIKSSASLDELGIDSLLMLEMEESFRNVGNNSFTAVDFEKCITVDDIVELLNSAVADGADSGRKVIAITEEQMSDHTQEVFSIISKACDIPAANLALPLSLDELGIDSLLMIEMEESFRGVGGTEFTAVDFEKCLTVGDIVDLINVAKISRLPSSTRADPVSVGAHADIVLSIRRAIAQCCKMDASEIVANTSLDDLGIDSLMMLELEHEFHSIAPTGFKTMYLKDCRTVQDVIDLVGGNDSASATAKTHAPADASVELGTSSTAKISASVEAPRVSKVRDPTRRKRIEMDPKTEQLLIERLGLAQQPEKLQSAPPGASNKAAIFLIHAGSGFSRPYYRLSTLLGRDIWAIHDDKLLQQHEPWNSVSEVAQTYASFVRKAANGKPAIISGWSFGGIIAYEVAKLLQREGSVSVPGLLLCDPPPPNGYTNPRVADLLHRLFAKIFGVQSSRQNALGDALHKIAASNAIRCADLLADYTPTTTGKAPKTAFLYAVDPVTTEFLAEEGDEHAPYDAWLCERENRGLALGGWFDLLGKDIKIIDLPGNHYNILERDKVNTTSAAYMEACDWIESEM